MCQRNLFHLFNRFMWRSEKEVVLTTIFYPSSLREVVFVSVDLTIELVMEMALILPRNDCIGVCSDKKLSCLEDADDVLVFGEDPSKLQAISERLNGSVQVWGMFCTFQFVNAVTSVDWTDSQPSSCMEEIWGGVDRFSYLGSCISPSGFISH